MFNRMIPIPYPSISDSESMSAYCNNVGQNKEHDKNPDKFHAWMDSQRKK